MNGDVRDRVRAQLSPVEGISSESGLSEFIRVYLRASAVSLLAVSPAIQIKEAVPGKDGFMGLLKDLSGCGTKGPSHRGKFVSQDGVQSLFTELSITLTQKN